jgi:hypothetical protein
MPDLVLWRANRLLYVECKRRGKDRFRTTQVRWLQAALECGVRMEEVLVVERVPTAPGGPCGSPSSLPQPRDTSRSNTPSSFTMARVSRPQ